MKKNTNTLLTKQILLVLSLTFCSHAHGMDLSQNIKSFMLRQLEDQSYIIGKYFVMASQVIQLRLTLFVYQLSPQARTLGIQIATNQLKVIEQNLKDAEQKAINDLFAEFKIDAEAQSLITSFISQTKDCTMKHYLSPDKKGTHDPEFPCDIFSILEKNNINPLGVNLKLNSKDEGFDALTRIEWNTAGDEDKNRFTCSSYPSITLCKQRYFAHSTKNQKSLLIHEVEHLASMHGIASVILCKTISSSANKPISEIENSKHYKELDIIVERQAEIFPAIRSAQDAEILAHSRYYGNYPGYLHLGHLKQLTDIQNLHYFIEKLENQKLNTRIPLLQSPQHRFSQKPKVVPADRISATAQQLANE